jgi:hypothetical protein
MKLSIIIFMFVLSILSTVVVWFIANLFFEITVLKVFFFELLFVLSKNFYMFISRKVLPK